MTDITADRARADQVFSAVKQAVEIEWTRAQEKLAEGTDLTDLRADLTLEYFGNMDLILATGMLAWCITEMARATHEGDWG